MKLDLNPNKKSQPNDYHWYEPIPTMIETAYCSTELNWQATICYARLQKEIWKPLPECLSFVYAVLPPHTFPHISSSGDKIAYHQNESKFKDDVQTVAKVGKFLQNVVNPAIADIPESADPLTDNEIRSLVEQFKIETKGKVSDEYIYIGDTAEEFVEAYNSEIYSCMQYSNLDSYHIATDFHPAMAYASGDFEIITYKGDYNRIHARAVVRKATDTEPAKFWSVYPKDGGGDPETEEAKTLYIWLIQNGYVKTWAWLDGAELDFVQNDCEYITLPYLGPSNYSSQYHYLLCEFEGSHWFKVVYDEDGHAPSHYNSTEYKNKVGIDETVTVTYFCSGNAPYDAKFVFDTCGEAAGDEDDERIPCGNCGEAVLIDEATYIPEDDETVCDDCLRFNYVEVDDEPVHIDNAILDYEGNYILVDDAVEITSPSSTYYQEYMHEREATELDDGTYVPDDEALECSSHYVERNGEFSDRTHIFINVYAEGAHYKVEGGIVDADRSDVVELQGYRKAVDNSQVYAYLPEYDNNVVSYLINHYVVDSAELSKDHSPSAPNLFFPLAYALKECPDEVECALVDKLNNLVDNEYRGDDRVMSIISKADKVTPEILNRLHVLFPLDSEADEVA